MTLEQAEHATERLRALFRPDTVGIFVSQDSWHDDAYVVTVEVPEGGRAGCYEYGNAADAEAFIAELSPPPRIVKALAIFQYCAGDEWYAADPTLHRVLNSQLMDVVNFIGFEVLATWPWPESEWNAVARTSAGDYAVVLEPAPLRG